MKPRYTLKRDYGGYVCDYSPTEYKTFDEAMQVLNKTIQRIAKNVLTQGYDISIRHVCTDNYNDSTGYGYDAIEVVSHGTKVLYFISTFNITNN